jgi:NADPH-dependent 2,4-dienoyl-CoA reductase/sulfur reductase-like enzyme
MNHLIIGAGPAGVIAAETLRKLDPEASITLIGDEPESPYSRMALPYYLVKKIPEHGTYLRKTANHFDRSRIELKLGRVAAIQPEQHTVSLESSEQLDYDRLLIATGSHPVSPPIPGIDLPGVVPCWTLANARTIAEHARPGAKIVLMGAGFISCIILEALARSGADLIVVEMEDRMVPRMMNEKAGNLIKQWCLDRGVAVHTSTRIEAIDQGGRHLLHVLLDSGGTLDADLIVSATGVHSNIGFLDGSGIDTDQGILIDRNMQTNRPDVYAAGDVAQGLDFSTGDYSVQAIQPTAADHGQIAGRNMAGHTKALHRGSINMNVLDTLGLISSSFGLWMGVDGGETAELFDPERFRYLNLQFQDDILVGATSLGLTQHVGVLRGLIQSKIGLGKWRIKLMQDPTRIMEAYLATTQAVGFNAGVLPSSR